MEVYLHSVPGRLRVKSPALKGDGKKAQNVENIFLCVEGIESTKVNLMTGSLLIKYKEEKIGMEEIIHILKSKALVDFSKTISIDEYVHKVVSKAGSFASKVLFGNAMDKALEGSALSFLAILI